jgi:hypothetical protein
VDGSYTKEEFAMHRCRDLKLGILGILTMILLFGLPGLAEAQRGTQFNPQPLLLVTVSGGTIAGEILETLTVYDNGLAIRSVLDETGTSDIQKAEISRAEIDALIRDLRRAGTFRQHSRATADDQIPDTPLTTVTVFLGNAVSGNRALAHTFSFFAPEGNRARVMNVITEFINNTFGG